MKYPKSYHVALGILLVFSITTFSYADNGLYQTHMLVSDGTRPALHIDPNLKNPWGIAFGTTNPVWIANNGSATSTIYDGLGVPAQLVVTIPSAKLNVMGTPTGIVFNNTSFWVVVRNGKSAPATFIFATEDGTISGWSPTVDLHKAVITVNNSMKRAKYTGLTRGANGLSAYLYAANFSGGKVDIFDENFKQVNIPTAFIDPNLPQGYAPFNVQNINGDIYVLYGKQNADKTDVVVGDGLGIVNVFDAKGRFIRRVITGGKLNAPWGISLAPLNFGAVSNELLIGNFGNGKINAFNLKDYSWDQTLKGSNGYPIYIDKLWGLSFGNGFKNQFTNVLYFTAGPNDEQNGSYGTISPISIWHDFTNK